MSFKDIQLPDILLADLYKADVVVLSGEAQPQKQEKPKLVKQPGKVFLGENKKNVSILIKDENNTYIDDESLAFLSKMLEACKLSMADVAIVNTAKNATTAEELKDTHRPVNCLLFGITTQEIELPFTIPHYQVQAYNKCSYLTAPPLTSYLQNDAATVEQKKKLWMSLKKMFNI